jgi:hypothetical protein
MVQGNEYELYRQGKTVWFESPGRWVVTVSSNDICQPDQSR